MKRWPTYLLVLLFTGCASVPITNRKQLHLVSEYEILHSSKIAYTDFLDQHEVVGFYDSRSQLVKTVGENLVTGINKYFDEYGGKERITGYEWEFNLVEGEEVNAFCMPGGKIVVYTGMLVVSEDEVGLAVVMSHEIAHAVAQHTRESASQQVLAQTGSTLISLLLIVAEVKHPEIEEVIQIGYDFGATLGLLKFSRNHEIEADKMGMVFMEYAGYDSSKSVDFWKRMKMNNSVDNFVILNTHPTDLKRILEIEAFIPVAKSYVR